MRKALVKVNDQDAGTLEELENGGFRFTYFSEYEGAPISLTLPTKNSSYEFKHLPSFFEGLLPEGILLEALLRKYKLDKNDLLGQLLKVGEDVVGAVSIEEMK